LGYPKLKPNEIYLCCSKLLLVVFNAENAKIRISGSGDAQLVANSHLNARISGSGDIQYKGSPNEVDVKVSGSGSITKE
jgi:hypothetical protein|tara:strand:- start:9101 stop:9337 length:237 start_codon:yes stop_codon:yes gene_type:complete